ncbi:TPA: ribosomal-protein-alanine N-acetyltransferase [Candidatus Bathyarchaeota archaeon]|nr:ribosomal-protein-alanine N-acetyltransferase [Candidatus Bathyarchaeota archaeon]
MGDDERAFMPQDVKVRRFSPRDLDGVIEIERDSFKYPYDRRVFAYYRFASPDGFLVAEVEGKVVGYVIASTPPLMSEGKLVSIAVDPSYRGAGIGGELMRRAIEHLREAGRKRVSLEVRESNVAAIKFYEGFGFRRERVIPRYYQDGENAIRMSKELG